jgi:hypothetical protein
MPSHGGRESHGVTAEHGDHGEEINAELDTAQGAHDAAPNATRHPLRVTSYPPPMQWHFSACGIRGISSEPQPRTPNPELRTSPHTGDLKAFALQEGADFGYLISLNLDLSIFDRTAAAASLP